MSTIIGNPIIAGTPLPELTNPAVAGDIRYGKQSVDGDGEVLTGTIPNYEGETDTGTVIPVDTGENGLFKNIIEGNKLGDSIYDSLLTKITNYGLSMLGFSYAGPYLQFAEFENVREARVYSFGTTNCMCARMKFNKQFNFNGQVFRQNPFIKIVDLAGLGSTSSAAMAFRDCSLDAFIIRSDSFCPLAVSNFFYSAHPNMGIYVKPALVEEYKTATNWSAWASVINPFYLAPTVEDIQTLLDDPDIPVGSMIICDSAGYTRKYTKKEASE